MLPHHSEALHWKSGLCLADFHHSYIRFFRFGLLQAGSALAVYVGSGYPEQQKHHCSQLGQLTGLNGCPVPVCHQHDNLLRPATR